MQKTAERYIHLVICAKNHLFVYLVAYALGAVVGLFFSTALSKAAVAESVIRFYMNVFSGNYNVFLFALTLLVSDAVFLLIFYLCSFNYFLGIIELLLLFYRGYVLFSAAVVFINFFGAGGAFVYVFCVFVHSFAVSFALAAFSAVLSRALKEKGKAVKCLRNELTILSAFVILAAILLETLIIVLLIRPLNAIF